MVSLRWGLIGVLCLCGLAGPAFAGPATPQINVERLRSLSDGARKTQIDDQYSCVPRRTCKQIATCAEAMWYLQNCSWGFRLDRDGDGRPCEWGPC